MWYLFDPTPSASNWLERLPAGSIYTWEDLTTRFLAQFFPSGRTAKLCNEILMFQQHQGESISEAWTHFKDLLPKVPHHGIDRWLQIQLFYDHVSFHLKYNINHATGGKLHDKNTDESWEIIENLALYDHAAWNDSKDYVKLETPKKVLIREEARHPIIKNVNSISLIRIEEEENGENNRQIDKSVMEPSKSDEEEPPEGIDIKDEVERKVADEPAKVQGKMSRRMKRMS
ncbi:zinc finger, CCHC-type containing protein [Tanacetum coccineum]